MAALGQLLMLEANMDGGEAFGPPPDHAPLQTSDCMHTPQIEDALWNAKINLARGLRSLRFNRVRPGTLLIVGGGSSLAGHVDEIRAKHAAGAKIIAINDTYDYLAERGIVADYFAMCEIAPWPKEFLTRANRATTFFLADISHPTGFDRLLDAGGYEVMIWHIASPDEDVDWKPHYEALVSAHYPNAHFLGGGEAVSLKAINLGMALGFRDFEMYGVDGCYQPGETSHAYMDRRVHTMNVHCAGRDFETAYYLARQADDLRRFCMTWGKVFRLRCHGDGLVQHMHRTGFPEQYQGE